MDIKSEIFPDLSVYQGKNHVRVDVKKGALSIFIWHDEVGYEVDYELGIVDNVLAQRHLDEITRIQNILKDLQLSK